ncbi:MAG: hypothetical protein PW843_11860 [Azospirillaceae bacterium]|nr:hypothetical protein [Azospirillaceae bacterium]
MTGLEATGTTVGNSLYLYGVNDYVGGTLGSIANSGTLSANNARLCGGHRHAGHAVQQRHGAGFQRGGEQPG